MPDRPEPLPEISIVVPVYNEAGNVAALAAEIAEALAGLPYEMIFIDDASTDDTLAVLQGLQSRHDVLRVLSHTANSGQSRALRSGILAARAPIIGTLDGDGQNLPGDLPTLLDKLRADPSLALVGGERQARQDSRAKLLASRIGNGVRARLLGDGTSDTGCGIKVFDREAFLRLPYFDHIHRYIPALMVREGYRCAFAPVRHRAREFGQSKYTNLGRLRVSLADLRGVMWLKRRARLPGEVREL